MTRDARHFRAILCVITIVSALTTESPPLRGETTVLTNAAQVRNLSPAQTAKALPVRLSGVMMDTADVSAGGHAIILLDPTAGIYVLARGNIFAGYHRGDLLEVKGVTNPGQFAPIVIATTARKLGTAAIPKPQPATYQQLITGALDAQWVEVNGVVRQSFEPAHGSDIYRLIIETDGGLVPVRFYAEHGNLIQVDSEVRVRAICFYQFNQKGQVLSPVLSVPRGMSPGIIQPAPAHPYAAALRSADNLSMFSPENLYAYAHRVHVRGVVTCYQPGSFVWIRDGSAGLRIQTYQKADLQPGDKIDALGFPTFGSYTPRLEDAVFRKTGITQPPVPVALTNFDEAFNHADDLVAAEGLLTQIQPVLDGVAFTLQMNGKSFKAILKTPSGGPLRLKWQTASKVRITGICSLVHDDIRPMPGIWVPKSFEILLRSPADLAVVVPPPWWTPQHITMLLGVTTGGLVVVVAVIVALSRRRLLAQERQRQMAEAEFAAILSERNRLAREIHDTLAQGLTATSVQLRLARRHLNGASESVSRHLNNALTLVRDSLQEARNSIWNMRAHVLETGDLCTALEGMLKQMAEGTDTASSFEVTGVAHRLAPVVENNILRIGQEAISNAAKHSAARRIKVKLNFEERLFRLRVADDGCGFDPRHPPPTDGGLGLMGMRERAAGMNGELDIRSSPGKGSEVILSIPLSRE
jgi:signal transduction histidine kinase